MDPDRFLFPTQGRLRATEEDDDSEYEESYSDDSSAGSDESVDPQSEYLDANIVSAGRRQHRLDYVQADFYDQYENLLGELAIADPQAPLQPRPISRVGQLRLERDVLIRDHLRSTGQIEDEGWESEEDIDGLIEIVLRNMERDEPGAQDGYESDEAEPVGMMCPCPACARPGTQPINLLAFRSRHPELMGYDPQEEQEFQERGLDQQEERVFRERYIPDDWDTTVTTRPTVYRQCGCSRCSHEYSSLEMLIWDREFGGWQVTIPDGWYREVIDFDGDDPAVAGWGAMETLLAAQDAKFEVAPFQEIKRQVMDP